MADLVELMAGLRRLGREERAKNDGGSRALAPSKPESPKRRDGHHGSLGLILLATVLMLLACHRPAERGRDGSRLEESRAKTTASSPAIDGSQGAILEVWRGVPGSRVADLLNAAAYPSRPTETNIVSEFCLKRAYGDFYGVRLRALLVPPATGDYTFWIAADDEGQLWLSPDESKEKRKLISRTTEWTYATQWQKHPEQRSTPIHLVKGRRYYIEALMKQSGGSECLAVAWQVPGADQQVIGGADLKQP